MEANTAVQQQTVQQVYNYAADLLVNKKFSSEEATNALISQGLDHETATTVITNLEDQIIKAKKSRANKDMLYGALWCIGGIVATAANIGFIFWGAIVFGAIQFFKGVANAV